MKNVIFFLLFCGSFYSQNNIIPNPKFESATQATCTAPNPGSGQFNLQDIHHWKSYTSGGMFFTWESEKPRWLNLQLCSTFPDDPINCSGFGHDRFVRIASMIMNDNCNKIRKDNVAVALPNGATF